MKLSTSFFQPLIFGLLALSLSFISCRDEEDEEIEISAEDAARIVGSGLSDNSDALEEQADRSAQLNGAPNVAFDTLCGNPLDYMIDFRISRNSRTFDYTANGIRDGICTNDSLIAFQYTSSFTTRFFGPNYSSNGTGERNGRLDELRSDSTFYLWNGTTKKNTNGTLESRNETIQINSVLNYNSQLKIDKTSRRILSGTTDFTLSGSGDNVRAFSYSGSITYLGSRQAEVQLNGRSYTVLY